MTPHSLHYIITPDPETPKAKRASYFIQVVLVRDHTEFITQISDIPASIIQIEDHDILETLSSLYQGNKTKTIHKTNKTPELLLFPLEHSQGTQLFEQLIATHRTHFASLKTPPLARGNKQYGKFDWISEAEGKKRLHCWMSSNANIILPLEPLWYIDSEVSMAGELETGLDAQTAAILLSAPPLSHEEINQIYTLLKTSKDNNLSHLLKTYIQKITVPIEEKNIDHWYCNFNQASHKTPWIELELGIEHEGVRTNLLPPLSEFLQHQLSLHSFENFSALPDDKIFTLTIPPHRTLHLSMKKIKKILLIFTELYKEEPLWDGQKLRISALRALELSALKETLDVKSLQWQGETSLSLLAEKFSDFQKNQFSPLSPPPDFCGKLRAYQERGVHWLQFLCDTGFSGILADDMGLGKTVQVLMHLLLEKHKKSSSKPSLIVTHTSLTLNWQQEAARFTPSLRILILHGQSRHTHFSALAHYDAIITTYPLLVRDEKILSQQEFFILILDESQYIKNIYSKAGHAARRLNTERRLCLTGTPLENHLGELWSLFHFLMPGLLGDKKQFRELFRLPIEKNQNTERLTALKQRISPFFLRRVKKEVLPELPEKVEIIQPVLLTDIQKELYESIRIVLHQKVLETVKSQGISKSRIYILSALLKLRQICCDPRLLKMSEENYADTSSAKLQLIMELLPTLISEGRRILLFSQFTEMLALIEKTLEHLEIPYLLLTGKTQNRHEIISTFQEGKIPLFLISLKAGGVGLNLTKADTIIHYDPWWNPAVETQAADRAHRIGQEKSVFIYKLITSHTIEEKIQALQKEKQSLFDAILSENPQQLENFTLDDIEKLFAPLA